MWDQTNAALTYNVYKIIQEMLIQSCLLMLRIKPLVMVA